MNLMEIIEKCIKLQESGHNVGFTSTYGTVSVEHRESGTCELIVEFRMRDINNTAALKAISDYLETIEIGEGTL